MTYGQQVLDDLRPETRELRKMIPDVYQGFGALHGAAFAAGVLDTKTYLDEPNRSWIFRSVGYGHGADFWKDFVSTLRMIGYDGALSIEHEDSLMSTGEGLSKAVRMLKDVLITEPKPKAWWT